MHVCIHTVCPLNNDPVSEERPTVCYVFKKKIIHQNELSLGAEKMQGLECSQLLGIKALAFIISHFGAV